MYVTVYTRHMYPAKTTAAAAGVVVVVCCHNCQALMENSDTWENKTQYSQAKWLKRKKQK